MTPIKNAFYSCLLRMESFCTAAVSNLRSSSGWRQVALAVSLLATACFVYKIYRVRALIHSNKEELGKAEAGIKSSGNGQVRICEGTKTSNIVPYRNGTLPIELQRAVNKCNAAMQKIYIIFLQQCPLPRDILKIIFGYLQTAKDLVNSRTVCLEWKDAMDVCPNYKSRRLSYRIGKLLGDAKEVAASVRSKSKKEAAYKQIVKIEAGWDVEAAKRTVALLKGSPSAFFEARTHITEAEAQINPNAVNDLIISSLATTTEEKIRIIEIQAQSDPQAAKEQVHKMRDEVKSYGYLAIAKIEAQKNLQDAKVTADLIEGTDCKDSAYLAIVTAEAAQNQLEDARKTAEKITPGYAKDLAYLAIVKAEAAQNQLEDARKTAEKITSSDEKALAHIEIAKVAPNSDLEAAKEQAARIEHDSNRAEAYVGIVELEARRDLGAARKTAAGIRGEHIQVSAYLAIARIDKEHNLQPAKDAAAMIRDESDRDTAYREIVKVEAQYNSEEAEKTAALISGAGVRAKAVTEIAHVLITEYNDLRRKV